jgi:3alpha(or 20beta)-hydroxysteroid dehydrogenase
MKLYAAANVEGWAIYLGRDIMNRVEGKVALITGAARGIGAAQAKLLVKEGAKVMLTDVRDGEGAALTKELGRNARYLHQDVTLESEWQLAVQETEAVFGQVSILVNNAGIGSDGEPIESLLESAYRRVIDVDQVSVYLGMKAIIPSMKRSGGGSIINISSMAGIVGFANCLAYCAAKFAVRGMTKAAAIELARFKIRVNSIHPGLIKTDLTASTPETGEIIKAATAAIPLGRMGEPDEIASTTLLLASDESRFTTGAEFVIDGGSTCQ